MIKRNFISVVVAASAAVLLVGCSSASTAKGADTAAPVASTPQSSAAQRLTIKKDPASIADGQVALPVKRDLLLTVGEADAAKWTATVADGAIAEFKSGDAPTVHPLAEGETDVRLTSPKGETISFHLIVTPGAR